MRRSLAFAGGAVLAVGLADLSLRLTRYGLLVYEDFQRVRKMFCEYEEELRSIV